MSLTVGSLFSGIGGIDLGLERAGMTVRWQAETDLYCSRVLAKHWPHVPNLGDVTAVDWSTVERVDLICGGYPCQPFSYAGGRRGEDDERHLWPYFRDALAVLRPRLALLENVPGHLSLGFGRVLGDLAEIGYDAEWDCVPAAAVGAPHLRDRVFVVAYSTVRGRNAGGSLDGGGAGAVLVSPGGGRGSDGSDPQVAYAAGEGLEGGATAGGARLWRPVAPSERRWETEPDVGRVADGVPDWVDRLRGLGNAVVPQVAEWIGRRILDSLEAKPSA